MDYKAKRCICSIIPKSSCALRVELKKLFKQGLFKNIWRIKCAREQC